MAVHGIDHFDELVARSIAEPEWFWDAIVRFLRLRFAAPYDQVLDTSEGVPWARWFVGGRLNLAVSCIDRHAEDPARRDQPAVVWEGEEGTTRTFTYGELRVLTDRIAAG